MKTSSTGENVSLMEIMAVFVKSNIPSCLFGEAMCVLGDFLLQHYSSVSNLANPISQQLFKDFLWHYWPFFVIFLKKQEEGGAERGARHAAQVSGVRTQTRDSCVED
ncbi:hypothetical protein ATANTOWER_017479 [Ataeniobius toweri]|uniref:Uncharacterized protein n=1 Tax=Ataeniobius toweri TaxID=208326 RepID=A0ABU7AKT4_9TELE|nr:hypothetical protein [Ataeniobius toweri]